jgi:hypothetical protein
MEPAVGTQPVMKATAACSTILPGFASLNLQLTLLPEPAATNGTTEGPMQQPHGAVHVYLALDNSGSMSGRPIEEAKQAIGTFLDRAPLHQLESCHLIVYDNRVSLCQDMQGLTKMNRDNTVRA